MAVDSMDPSIFRNTCVKISYDFIFVSQILDPGRNANIQNVYKLSEKSGNHFFKAEEYEKPQEARVHKLENIALNNFLFAI